METYCLFNKAKFADRTNLLLPKNSCDISILQMILEHLVGSGTSEWDNFQLAKAIDASLTRGQAVIPNKNMLMVANGATGTIPEDIYHHYFDTILPSSSNVQSASNA